MELKERYVVCIEKTAYFAGINPKYPLDGIININLKKYAYCFETKKEAESCAAKIQERYRYEAAKAEKVWSSYTGYWDGGYCILGESYTEAEFHV